MFLFWYYIHIPIKNIMCLRGMRKAKDSCELETFRKRAILFYKIGKWLKHKIELKDKPKKGKFEKSRLIKFSRVEIPEKGNRKISARLQESSFLKFQICWIPNLNFFSSINFEGATVGDCFQMRMILIRI